MTRPAVLLRRLPGHEDRRAAVGRRAVRADGGDARRRLHADRVGGVQHARRTSRSARRSPATASTRRCSARRRCAIARRAADDDRSVRPRRRHQPAQHRRACRRSAGSTSSCRRTTRSSAATWRRPTSSTPPFAESGNILSTTLGGRDNLAQSLALGDTMVLSNNVVNNLRFAFNRTAMHRTHVDFFGPNDIGVNTLQLPRRLHAPRP